MSKRYLSHKSLYVGQLVVVSDAPEAQVYTIGNIDKTLVILMWYEGSRLCICHHDSYMLKKPDLIQIENSINFGQLVSLKSIVQRS